jgi:hypothetical protein
MRLRKSDASNDVAGGRASGDQRRPGVDHRVEDLPCSVVVRLAGREDGATKRRSKLCQGWLRDHHGVYSD